MIRVFRRTDFGLIGWHSLNSTFSLLPFSPWKRFSFGFGSESAGGSCVCWAGFGNLSVAFWMRHGRWFGRRLLINFMSFCLYPHFMNSSFSTFFVFRWVLLAIVIYIFSIVSTRLIGQAADPGTCSHSVFLLLDRHCYSSPVRVQAVHGWCNADLWMVGWRKIAFFT